VIVASRKSGKSGARSEVSGIDKFRIRVRENEASGQRVRRLVRRLSSLSVFVVLFIRSVVPSLKVLGLESPSACPAPLDREKGLTPQVG